MLYLARPNQMEFPSSAPIDEGRLHSDEQPAFGTMKFY